MTALVVLVGLVIAGIATAFLAEPGRLRALLRVLLHKRWLQALTALRILLGMLFVIAARDTRLPLLVLTVGILFIVAGVAIPLLGEERVQGFAGWWRARSDTTLRLWAALAALLGCLLVWAGL
jgi:hypothetical protein